MKIQLSAIGRKDATIYSICLHRIFSEARIGTELDSKSLACSENCGASMELDARGAVPVAGVGRVEIGEIDILSGRLHGQDQVAGEPRQFDIAGIDMRTVIE
jgi:hypothetical protein